MLEYDTYQVDYLLEDGQSIPNTFTTELLLPKGCGDPFISQWAPRTVGGHAFVRMEREGLALRLYYRQTAQTVPPEKPKLEGAVTIIGTPKYNQPLTATVTNDNFLITVPPLDSFPLLVTVSFVVERG